MWIRIDRRYKREGYTISRVYINEIRFGDGKKWCMALEDTDRGLRQDMPLEEIKKRKIYGKTAIPSGRYNVTIAYSPKFKRKVPYVNDVKGFSGILLHAGNTAKDTLGCILFGENTKVGKVLNSRKWVTKIENLIKEALAKGEKVTLIINE